MGSLADILFSLLLISGIRVGHQAVVLDMMPNTFDDQYIGCEDEMERKVLEILEEELKYNQFAVMWEGASKAWKGKRKSLSLPSNFDDNYGIAVVLYTMEEPHLIYKQLNGNVSIMGKSRDLYMKNFHFKALHFYLTRALQVLRTGCAKKTWVYRGTSIGDVDVAKKIRFGQFASSSINILIAKGFGENTFFNILTCYGVDIADLSDYEEQEYLIPVAETFNMINQIGTKYVLESTGKLCSYFNCAYLGGEKRSSPVCTSESSVPAVQNTVEFLSHNSRVLQETVSKAQADGKKIFDRKRRGELNLQIGDQMRQNFRILGPGLTSSLTNFLLYWL